MTQDDISKYQDENIMEALQKLSRAQRTQDFNDIVGKKFGRLKVLKVIPRPRDKEGKLKKDKRGYPLALKYLCACDCGEMVTVYRGSLLNGRTRSCGCLTGRGKRIRKEEQQDDSVYNDIIGQRFGKLVVERLVPRERDSKGFIKRSVGGRIPFVTYECVCDCGNHVTATRYNLLEGKTNSCGCLRKESASRRYGFTSQSKSSVCKDCQKRTAICHIKCEAYLKEVEQRKAIYEAKKTACEVLLGNSAKSLRKRRWMMDKKRRLYNCGGSRKC